MAPRKATKHTDTEMVEKTAKAGDVSPPKRKKTAIKIANKSEEKKEIRLPRAAKSGKTDSIEITEPALVPASTKNVKNKGKIVPPKNTTTAVKANSKIRPATRKGKDINEEIEAKTQNTDIVQAVEEVPIKKSRAKTTTKKAGMEIEEEAGVKSKKRPKKNAVVTDVEKLEEPMTKQRKNMENTDAAATSDKPKPRKTKKQPNKVPATKSKSVSSNDNNSNADKTEESTVTQTSGQAPVRNTRGRKNGNVDKAMGEALSEQDSKENQEVQTDRLDSMESIKPPKKGRNVRKKDEVPQKDSIYHNENKNDNDMTEESDVPPKKNKKLNNKSASTLPTARKMRGRKMEASDETSPENDQDSNIREEVLVELDGDEKPKAQTDAAVNAEVIQEPKKGRNVKKTDEGMSQKNVTKKRGKAANADTAATPDGTHIEKSVNDSLKKVKEGKENDTIKSIPAIAVTPVDDNSGRRTHSDDTSINENQTVTLVTNNNMQKLSEQNDDGKESRTQLEKNSGKHREVSEIDEKSVEETVTTVAENNV